MLRLGVIPFPISVRNSPQAVASLIHHSNAMQVFVSPDDAMNALIASANELLDSKVEVLEMIQFDDVCDDKDGDNEAAGVAFPMSFDLDSIAIFFHTSGTRIHSCMP